MCFHENIQPCCCPYLNMGNILCQVFKKNYFNFYGLVMLETAIFIQGILLKPSLRGKKLVDNQKKKLDVSVVKLEFLGKGVDKTWLKGLYQLYVFPNKSPTLNGLKQHLFTISVSGGQKAGYRLSGSLAQDVIRLNSRC